MACEWIVLDADYVNWTERTEMKYVEERKRGKKKQGAEANNLKEVFASRMRS